MGAASAADGVVQQGQAGSAVEAGPAVAEARPAVAEAGLAVAEARLLVTEVRPVVAEEDISRWIQLPRQGSKGRAARGASSPEEPWQV